MSKPNLACDTTAVVSAMRSRANLSSGQTRKGAGWIYTTHVFRNATVAFLNARRGNRAGWVENDDDILSALKDGVFPRASDKKA